MCRWSYLPSGLTTPCLKGGIREFQGGNFSSAAALFDEAAGLQLSQPIVQRGVTLYLLGRYEEALTQLLTDTERLEKLKLFKASDLRLWMSACCNKLKLVDYAVQVLGNWPY